MVPKSFFVVKGKGISYTSMVNAFDAALIDSGLGNVNIVPVSSIIPGWIQEIPAKKIEDGSMVYSVLSKATGVSGEKISTGLIWGWGRNSDSKLGFVVTAQQSFIDDNTLAALLEEKIREMSTNRKMELTSFKTIIESLEVPHGSYGCVIVVFIYVF